MINLVFHLKKLDLEFKKIIIIASLFHYFLILFILYFIIFINKISENN